MSLVEKRVLRSDEKFVQLPGFDQGIIFTDTGTLNCPKTILKDPTDFVSMKTVMLTSEGQKIPQTRAVCNGCSAPVPTVFIPEHEGFASHYDVACTCGYCGSYTPASTSLPESNKNFVIDAAGQERSYLEKPGESLIPFSRDSELAQRMLTTIEAELGQTRELITASGFYPHARKIIVRKNTPTDGVIAGGFCDELYCQGNVVLGDGALVVLGRAEFNLGNTHHDTDNEHKLKFPQLLMFEGVLLT